MACVVVDGCYPLQWVRYLSWNEDPQLSLNEAVSLAWHVEYTIIQVVLTLLASGIYEIIQASTGSAKTVYDI